VVKGRWRRLTIRNDLVSVAFGRVRDSLLLQSVFISRLLGHSDAEYSFAIQFVASTARLPADTDRRPTVLLKLTTVWSGGRSQPNSRSDMCRRPLGPAMLPDQHAGLT
jgi:hypothetical protein